QMPRVEKVAPLTMQWCLSCHRDPAAVLKRNPPPRPEHDALWGAPERVLDGFANHPVRDIDSLTTCTACHR
ncbi:MAG TPA: cytochrome C, partial [Polyangiaceae bacterium]